MFSRLFKPDVEKLARKRDVDGLKAAFGHEDAHVRAKALRALVVLQPDGLEEILAEALTDESEDVRDVAVSAGAQPLELDLDDQPAIAPAPPAPASPPPAPAPEPPRPQDVAQLRLGLLSPDPSRRAEAAEGLGALADTGSETALIAALGDEDSRVRASAAGALDALPRTRATVFALVDALQDAERVVRERAARSLGRLGDPTAVGPLLDGLEQGSAAAARALGEIGDPRALGPLLDALRSPALAGAAAEALGRLGEPVALPALDALAATEGEGARAARDAAARLRSRRGR